jgi:multicomponent K+:H+ antiporter subunit F
MLSLALTVAFAAVGVSVLLTLLRLVKGPDTTDRILALDTLTINAIAFILLLGIRFGTTVYFEAALILAMMGFVGTIALCKFLLGGDIIE